MPCAMRCTASHSVASHLSGQSLRRTRGAKILGTAARQRIETGGPQPRQHLGHRQAVVLVEEVELDGGEGLEVHRGRDALEAREQVRVVGEGQAGVQAIDDVDFRRWVAGVQARAQAAIGLFERHGVRARVLGLAAGERAEAATRHADVGGVDVQVAVEVGALAVQPFAHLVGELPHLEQVGMAKERHAIVEVQGHARPHLRLYLVETHDRRAQKLAGEMPDASPRHRKRTKCILLGGPGCVTRNPGPWSRLSEANRAR